MLNHTTPYDVHWMLTTTILAPSTLYGVDHVMEFVVCMHNFICGTSLQNWSSWQCSRKAPPPKPSPTYGIEGYQNSMPTQTIADDHWTFPTCRNHVSSRFWTNESYWMSPVLVYMNRFVLAHTTKSGRAISDQRHSSSVFWMFPHILLSTK